MLDELSPLPHDHQHPSERDMEWWMLFCFTETRACNASKVKAYLGNTRKVLQCKDTTSGRPSLAARKSYCLWHWKTSTQIFILSWRTTILLKHTDFIYISMKYIARKYRLCVLGPVCSLKNLAQASCDIQFREVKTGKFCLATKCSYTANSSGGRIPLFI